MYKWSWLEINKDFVNIHRKWFWIFDQHLIKFTFWFHHWYISTEQCLADSDTISDKSITFISVRSFYSTILDAKQKKNLHIKETNQIKWKRATVNLFTKWLLFSYYYSYWLFVTAVCQSIRTVCFGIMSFVYTCI